MTEGEYPIWDERHKLANFGPVMVTTRQGRDKWADSERLYQATKFLPSEHEIREQIKLAKSPSHAKAIARENKSKVRGDWDDDFRFRVMSGIIRLKVRQNPDVQQELLGTGEKIIYEDADKYAPTNPDRATINELRRWGIYKGKGTN